MISCVLRLSCTYFLVLFDSFLQSNGYKPTPLDLSTVQMSEVLEDLVDMLAENTHNVWAKDRIKNGWTYGLCEVGPQVIFLVNNNILYIFMLYIINPCTRI